MYFLYLKHEHNLTKEADRVKGESVKIVCETITQSKPIPEFSDTIQRILETTQRAWAKIFMSS